MNAHALVAITVGLAVAVAFASSCPPARMESYTPRAADAPTLRVVRSLPVTDSGLAKASTDKDIVLKKNGISMVFAKRLAGAVWRMDWKNHLVIPELDGNGGSLQVALAFDIPVGESPEVENPTEAGSMEDHFGKTTSRWLRAAKSDSAVFTESQLAYYYPPGRKVMSSPKGTPGRGRDKLSDVRMKKRVEIGWKFPNVVNFDIDLSWKDDHWFTQIQILAVYLARAFDTLYLVKRGKAVKVIPKDKNNIVASSPPDTAYPIIMAKSPSAAVGLYAHTVPEGGTYELGTMPWYAGNVIASGHRDFGKGLRQVDLTNVTAVWHAGSQLSTSARIPKAQSFGIALVFGSVDEVAATIGKLSDMLAKG